MRLWVVGMMLCLSGCVATPTPVIELPVREPIRAEPMIWHHTGPQLNVSIARFDPGLRAGADDQQRALRNAESLYLPVLLQAALVESEGWGSVRVLPQVDPAAELQVTGRIDTSDGIALVLRLHAVDATGRVWLEREYRDFATDHGYAGEWDYRSDPFADLYRQVSNDLGKIRASMAPSEAEKILDVATLRYAAALSPDVFNEFLTLDATGRVDLVGLPAREDSMFARVRRIRESEYAFVDTVDAAYQRFYYDVGQTYTYWRGYSYELVLGNEVLAADGTEVRRARSWGVLDNVYETYRDSKLNEDALRQMTESFDAEVTPTTAAVGTALVELEGSLGTKYRQWRRILSDIYSSERVPESL